MQQVQKQNTLRQLSAKEIATLIRHAIVKASKKHPLASIYFSSIKKPTDSSNFGTFHWLQFAQLIMKEYDNYAGFLLLHGTDTMAYTAAALSFQLLAWKKPVVLTGAQRHIFMPYTDAWRNILGSIRVLQEGYVEGVVIFFGQRLLRGVRSSKVSTLSLKGFDSPHVGGLGRIKGGQIAYDKREMAAHSQRICPFKTIKEGFEARIAVWNVRPEMNLQIFEAWKKISCRGMVLRSYGMGNVPSEGHFLEQLEAMIQRGVLIVNVSACWQGRVQDDVYDGARKLAHMGVVSGADMTLEAATVKLMWVLAQTEDVAEAKKAMATLICGEKSV